MTGVSDPNLLFFSFSHSATEVCSWFEVGAWSPGGPELYRMSVRSRLMLTGICCAAILPARRHQAQSGCQTRQDWRRFRRKQFLTFQRTTLARLLITVLVLYYYRQQARDVRRHGVAGLIPDADRKGSSALVRKAIRNHSRGIHLCGAVRQKVVRWT